MLAEVPIMWKTVKQTAVALLTAEAEYISAPATAKELTLVVRLMKELEEKKLLKKPVAVFCDSQAAVELTRSDVVKRRSKHIDIKMHHVRDVVNNDMLTVTHSGSS